MPQSPQCRPLVQSISLEHSQKVFHQTTHTKHFPRTLTQITSLEHSHKALHLKRRRNYFTRTFAQGTSLVEHSREVLHWNTRMKYVTITLAQSTSPEYSNEIRLRALAGSITLEYSHKEATSLEQWCKLLH
jgi:hypothetical protein